MDLTATTRVSFRSACGAVLASALLSGGCGSGGGPTPGPAAPGPAINTPGTPSAPNTPVSRGNDTPASPVAQAAEGVIAPKDAKYTIVCTSFAGPAHVQQARVSKDNLIKATGRREFYVVHDEAQSTLYYGYYRERERNQDAAEAARASKDMDYVRSLADGENRPLFSKSLVVPLPMPDPVAPPEYDLARLDADKPADDAERRYWSLAIADYTGDVGGIGRKKLAVDSVIEARGMGYEAYYYHGPNTSTVCIGAWPRRAVREQEAVEAQTSGDTGQELLVSNAPIPKALTDQIERSGRDVKVMQPKVDIDDPSMLAVMKEFQDYSLNGNPEVNKITDPTTGKITRRPKQSFLVEIPKAQRASLLAGDRPMVNPAEAEPAMASPLDAPRGPALPGGPAGGGGRLRSVTP